MVRELQAPLFAIQFARLLEASEVLPAERTAREYCLGVARIAYQLGILLGSLGFHDLAHQALVFDEEVHRDASFSSDAANHWTKTYVKAVLDQLGSSVVLVVGEEDRGRFRGPLLSPQAAAAFAVADSEMREAGKSFALGLFTAAVMHAMRALEEPLRDLSGKVGLPRQDISWGPLLDKVESAILRLPSKSAADKDLRQRMSDAATNLRFFKDAWRNHVMHGRETYERESADSILRHVSSFIESMARP